jgi:hypothetical protein
VVLEAEGTVGLGEVPHTTPLAVIAYPPSEEMFPPLEAEVVVIEPIAEVEEILGDEPTNVVNDISEPYVVPAGLVA